MGQNQMDLHRRSRVLYRRSARAGGVRPPAAAPPDLGDLHRQHLDNIARLERTRQKAAVQRIGIDEPDKDILSLRPPAFWIRHQAVPLEMLGRTALVLMADPASLAALRQDLRGQFDEVIPIPTPAAEIEAILLRALQAQMTREAARSVAPALSCRSFDYRAARAPAFATGTLLCLFSILAPHLVTAVLAVAALVTLLMFTALRISGLLAAARPDQPKSETPKDLPQMSMLVPLYREAEIGKHLLRRLCRLTYPRDRLEVLLVLEENDDVTRNAVKCADLPDWFRVVEVPGDGTLTTKPRAMNYALNFCRGEIIGIWDAEDAPAPDQLESAASAFAHAPPDVVCFQGILDFYNPSRNLISRCFTLEYAGWFRVLLQGIARLGLVIPLGGTTLFIRRDALEQLGAWDAHNVTEDADLGVRIARAGYRTEMLPTTTYEEANSRITPWIKQRSRWLKGFMMTYLVHMRAPKALLRDVGWRRFWGLQAFFLGTLGQFLLAPVLWSFWLVALGVSHPLEASLPRDMLSVAVGALVFFEVLNLCIWYCGARASERPVLAFCAPLMPLYFILGCFAAYKALWEVFAAPFFWDKTAHGDHGGTTEH